MKYITLLYLGILFSFSSCHHETLRDGRWVNKNVRNAILKDSLKYQQIEKSSPLFFEISNKKIATFLQVEPSVEPTLDTLIRVNDSIYKYKTGLLQIINKNEFSIDRNNQELEFVFVNPQDRNDIFNVYNDLTKSYIDFSRIETLVDNIQKQKYDVVCNFNSNKVVAKGKSIKFNYRIFCDNPYYFKNWNDLNYYLELEINYRKEKYLIKKYEFEIHLINLETNEIRYKLIY